MQKTHPRGAVPPCADSPCSPRVINVPFDDLDCIHWLDIQEPEAVQMPQGVDESLPAATSVEEVRSV